MCGEVKMKSGWEMRTEGDYGNGIQEKLTQFRLLH